MVTAVFKFDYCKIEWGMKSGDVEKGRTRWVHLRLTPKEHEIIHIRFSATTCRSLSEFIRSALMDYPLVTKYRNTSQDDLLLMMGRLTMELNAVGNNVNQSVKKLHSLKENEINGWASLYLSECQNISDKIAEIKLLMLSLAEQWLR